MAKLRLAVSTCRFPHSSPRRVTSTVNGLSSGFLLADLLL